MTRNPQPTQGTPTSRWRSIRTAMTLPLLSHWSVVLALALFVYVCGVVISLAVAATYADFTQGKSPSCSVVNFGTPSPRPSVTP